jgi:hypothetical protein
MAALVLLVRVLVLVWILTLAARILLLLTRFLTATLLLAGLLAWVLVLLTRVLILVGHRDPPFQRHLQQRPELPLVARELVFRWADYMATVCRRRGDGTDRLKYPVQAVRAVSRAVAAPGSHVRKWDKAR